MSVADGQDMADVRRLYNAQAGVYQVEQSWDPGKRGDVTFVQRDSGQRLLAFLVAGLSPHPLDGQLEPEMKLWYSNPAAPAAQRARGLWAVALEMAEHFRLLGHQRTFGRTIGGAAIAAEAQHDAFRLVESDEVIGESYVIADDREATMEFLRERATVVG